MYILYYECVTLELSCISPLYVYRKKWPGWVEQYEIQHYKFLPLPTYCFCHLKSHTHSQLFSCLLFFCLLPLALTWQVLMGVLFVHSELIGRLFESVTSVMVEDLRKCCCQSVGFPNSSDVCKSRKMLTRQRSSKVFFFSHMERTWHLWLSIVDTSILKKSLTSINVRFLVICLICFKFLMMWGALQWSSFLPSALTDERIMLFSSALLSADRWTQPATFLTLPVNSHFIVSCCDFQRGFLSADIETTLKEWGNLQNHIYSLKRKVSVEDGCIIYSITTSC